MPWKILLNIDDAHMDEAESWIKNSIAINEHYRMPCYLAWDYTLYAEFFKKKGDLPQAEEKLGKAIELMRAATLTAG